MPPRAATRSAAVARFLFKSVLVAVAAVGLAPSGPAVAQPSADAADAAGRSDWIEEVAPELFYLEDDAGQLVPVPGFRYRDFVDLLRLKEGLPGLPEVPAAVVERIAVRADLAGGAAGDGGCPVTVEIVVRHVRPGWGSVSLELGEVLLTAPVRHEGQGRLLLTAEPSRPGAAADAPLERGYRAWLEDAGTPAAADNRHTILLEGRIAVDSSPTHESFAIHLPAATASLLELRTPRVDPLVTVHPRSVQPRVERVEAGAGAGSLVTVVGLSGPAHVRLGERRTGGQNTGFVPQAMVESLVRIDGKVAVTEATVRLDGLPPDVSTLRITLPPGATVRSVRTPSLLAEPDGTQKADVAVVRIDRGADGRAVVEMECERPIDASGRSQFQPLGFAVADIPPWRQWGRASLLVEGDWQVEWDEPGGNRRVDPPPAARRPGFIAAFAYDAQPASLPLRVRPRGSRVVIEPDYRYEVGATRIGFDATLRVSVRGAPASRIVVGLDGWNVDEVGPAGIVDTAAVTAEDGRLVIPFLQGLSGDAIVEVRGSRSIERSAARVGWRMPVPQADLVGQASVVISTASDIELLPDAGAIRGLARQVAPAPQPTSADRIALAYRVDGPEGVFAADRRFLPRRVDATVGAQVDVGDTGVTVRETMRLTVAHVPMEFVELMVPVAVMESDSLEVRQDGQLLNPIGPSPADAGRPAETGTSPTSTGDDAGSSGGLRDNSGGGLRDNSGSGLRDNSGSGLRDNSGSGLRVRYLLAAPLLGTGEIGVRYDVPLPNVPPETTVADDLPLVLPAGVNVGRQTVLLASTEPLAIDVRGDAWKRDVSPHSALPSRLWTSARPQEFVPLTLSASQRSTTGETVVDAAWLETRMLPDRREDTFTYSISTSGDRIVMTLPAGFVPATGAGRMVDAVEVRLDGRLQPAAVRSDGSLAVDLPRETGRGAWLLEIHASRPRERTAPVGFPVAGMPSSVLLEPPLFAAGTVQRRFYWELRLEADEHVVVPPSRWTSQQRWEWTPLGPERRPIVSREVLDGWVRAETAPAREAGDRPTRRDVELPVAERRAVYSGVGPPGAARVWMMPTWLLVLAVSGPVLAAGLALVYRQGLRRVSVVTAAGACLAIAAALLPDLAPLVAQAAIPGMALSLVAALLRVFIDRGPAADRGRTDRMQPPRPQVAVVSASSLTRAVSPPSLIVAPSSLRQADSVTTPGRSAS